MVPDTRPIAHEPDAEIPAQEVKAALAEILRSPQFQASPRLCDFLRYIVEKKLAGQEGYLKEYVIGTDVFGRAANYDPRTDPIVRSHAGRLRRKLEEYYAGPGQSVTVIISLPKGHYVPVFTRRLPEATEPALSSLAPPPLSEPPNSWPAAEDTAEPMGARASRRWLWGVMLIGAVIGATLGWAGVVWLERLGLSSGEQRATGTTAEAGVAESAQVAVPPEIDGLVDTVWTGRLRHRLERRLQGRDGIKASFGTLWDAANLYLMVEVREEGGTARPARARDEVEVYLDMKNERRRSYGVHNFQFILPAVGGVPSEQNNRVAGVRMASAQETWGYRVEAAIPWSTLGAKAEAGRKLGFDLAVRCREALGSYLIWQGTADNWFDPSGFGTLVLAADLANAALTTVTLMEAEGTMLPEVMRVLNQEAADSSAPIRLRFALPDLLPRVLSARLRLFCSGLGGPGRGNIVKVYGAALGKTAATASDLRTPVAFQSALLIVAPAMWYEWDITPVVRQAAEAHLKTVELTLRSRDTGNTGEGWVEFAVRRATSTEPRLLLEY